VSHQISPPSRGEILQFATVSRPKEQAHDTQIDRLFQQKRGANLKEIGGGRFGRLELCRIESAT